MKQLKLTFLFLVINFGGLAIGSWLMNNGPTSDWYTNLNQAPWTPPGWAFGVAWTLIMIFFSIYLSKLFIKENSLKMKIIFLFQFILNVSWNYIFFNKHLVLFGLITIMLLTALLFNYFFKLSTKVSNYKYLLLPYMIWLCIANSLNLYILIHN
ncbi:TspO protein [Polaribacter reichenbachii]|uniref:TspO protein n=1 Tax=Polaribacter reichenbachii TaxID=996801 RepID=A0A1B8U4Q2_9FLAO|nr:TspO/MBR family protein [Polaribacter reichenbachii]APZ44868.1 TspO protein [Polaribacter reichenbachii]AUC18732.1 TspO protein [Polaribacter reichenbachii]OBY66845.1 TspO protein [Polaribacter reichenbachii]